MSIYIYNLMYIYKGDKEVVSRFSSDGLRRSGFFFYEPYRFFFDAVPKDKEQIYYF